jgi:two-component system sensor histidine kinase/response regulator
MQKIINFTDNNKSYSKNIFHKEFLFVENVSKLKKINSYITLCIIQTNFNEADIKIIKKLKSLNKDTIFWLSSKELSKENILKANKININTVIPSPFDYTMVEDFFNERNRHISKNINQNKNYDYSCISNSKIMIVDDNLMNVELLKEILSEFNLSISAFLKPGEALKSVNKEKFDLFLLDIMMPGMSGFELAKKIKETSLNKNTPIVFISALSDSYTKIKGYDLGSFAYIEKPFDINIIKSQIFNILKTQKTQELISSGKESFLATVIHDLKTPINAGINALNLLLGHKIGSLKDSQQEIVEDILNSTKFMQDMVENLLCKNKMENDKIILNKQTYSLEELIKHCIESAKHIIIPKNQNIELQCDLENTFLQMDFLEMKRAINNLITNSSEYSQNGTKILINIFSAGKKIGFCVKDFGRGIDLKNPEEVFAQYMSLAKQNKRVGSGLGLYITKKIIEEHGGEIFLTSQVGIGTTITIYLPR